MDEADRFAAAMRAFIEEIFADSPRLRDFNLEVLEQEIARVRSEDAEGKAH